MEPTTPGHATRTALAEALVPLGILQAWVWLSPYPRAKALDALAALAVLAACAVAVARHGPRDRRAFGLGPAADHRRAALPILAFTTGAALGLWALVLRRARPPDLAELLATLATYPLRGMLQQALVLGVLLPRLLRVAGPRGGPWATAALFALAHAPNPVLMGGGFALVAFLAHVWRRAPSLPLAGLCHGVLGALLDEGLDLSLRIGRGFLAP